MIGKLNLLLGAGFSRNWGGWLAQELLGELLGRVNKVPEVYRRLLIRQNFEQVLFEVQTEARQTAVPEAKSNLAAIETAIHFAFWDMNRHFLEVDFEFSNFVENSVRSFLRRFDRIFTLNQDLLLELQYHTFDGAMQQFPGVNVPVDWNPRLIVAEHFQRVWYPSGGEVREEKGSQPIYKLHGSANWRESAGESLIVMGGGKAAAIERSPLLKQYADIFRNQLTAGDAKLMVIGYSFQDEHINEIIKDASQHHGLQLYLVNPRGLSLFDPPPQQLVAPRNEYRELRWVGISTRTLRETFSSDTLQRRSLERFVVG